MKLNKIIQLSTIIFFTANINAQNLVVDYNQTIDLGEPELSIYKLYTKENSSLYFDTTAENTAILKEEQEDNLRTISITEEHKPNNIYIDFSKQALYQSSYLGNKNYVVEENLYPFKWNITNETKQIASYTCTKATTKFRGRNYEAWFTDEIPTQTGPWKMHGLPGLILEVYDADHLIVIQAQKINAQSLGKEQTDVINKIQEAKTIRFKEYNQLFTEHMKEMFRQMMTKMPEGFSGAVEIDDNCEDCQSIEIYEEWEK